MKANSIKEESINKCLSLFQEKKNDEIIRFAPNRHRAHLKSKLDSLSSKAERQKKQNSEKDKKQDDVSQL